MATPGLFKGRKFTAIHRIGECEAEIKKPRTMARLFADIDTPVASQVPVVLKLDSSYVNSCRAFLAVLNFKLNVLAFGQSFEAVTLDCREVYEYIFAAVSRSNETKTFGLVEPLNLTFNLCHLQYSLMYILRP
jgi:hypothetical protein